MGILKFTTGLFIMHYDTFYWQFIMMNSQIESCKTNIVKIERIQTQVKSLKYFLNE